MLSIVLKIYVIVVPNYLYKWQIFSLDLSIDIIDDMTY
jgi:hypothetical protein